MTYGSFNWLKTIQNEKRKPVPEVYLSDVFLLFLLECELDEDLLQFLITVVDDKLLKTVVLQINGKGQSLILEVLVTAIYALGNF